VPCRFMSAKARARARQATGKAVYNEGLAQPIQRLILLGLILFFVGATCIWVGLDRTPPSWDDAFYLKNSLILYDAFADGGVYGFIHQFLHGMKTKPPLIAALPVPAYWIAGRRIRAAYAVNLGFMLVLLGVLFHLGGKYAGTRAGLLAVFVAGTMPMLYGLSHWFLADYGLTALVAVAICMIAGFNEGTRWPQWALLGIVCGLGLLMKMSFPLYLAVPIIYVGIRYRAVALRPAPLIAFVASAAIVALPWYSVNLAPALRTALNAGSTSTAKAYATGEVLAWADLSTYLVNAANAGPAIYFFLLAVLAPFAWRLAPAAKSGMLLCALWGSPAVLLVFGHYRDLRYAAPVFPAVALGLAILVDFAAAGRGLKAWAMVCAVLLLPLLSMLQSSFGILGKYKFELGGLLLVEPRFDYARRYDRASWPQREIIFDIARDSGVGYGQKERVLLGSDSVRFNADNFGLAATSLRLPLEFSSTAYDNDPSVLISRVNSTSYFVYKDGGEADTPNFNVLGKTAIQEVRASASFRELAIAPVLPDGGVARVFVNEALGRGARNSAFESSDLGPIEQCNVTFADRIGLTGCSIVDSAQGLDLRLRWKSLRPVERDYWCFIHVLDRSGRVVGQMDHQILRGHPPTREWKPGDVSLEKLFFASKERPLRFRLGLFEPSSGDRLPISSSAFPLADRQTAAILGENTGHP